MTVPRRGFLARLAAASGAVAAILGTPRLALAQAQQPATHDLDKWLDALAGQHRLVLDCVTTAHIGEMAYARNFYTANGADYGLKDTDLSVVVILRHEATVFGYNDAMWAKFRIGESLEIPARNSGGRGGDGGADRRGGDISSGRGADIRRGRGDDAGGGRAGNAGAVPDSVTRTPSTDSTAFATRNPQLAMITQLASRGARFPLCGLATTRYASEFGRKTGQQPSDVRAELLANLVPGAHVVPAGVVAVNRTQERGFTYLYVG
jgi:hypothetical protein